MDVDDIVCEKKYVVVVVGVRSEEESEERSENVRVVKDRRE